MGLELDVIGHRGAAGLLPENTMPGFLRAAELGCTAVETDLRRVNDIVYLLHDADLDRSTSGTGRVHHPQDLDGVDAGDGAPIPRLDDLLGLLDRYPALDLHLEVKENEVAELLVPRLLELTPERQARITLSSFHPDALPLPLCERWPRALCSMRMDAELLEQICERRYQAVHLADDCVDGEWVRRCQDRGLLVRVFTVNRRERADQLAAWGVDAIFTDRPDLMLA